MAPRRARDQCRRHGSGNDRQRHSGGERDQRGDDRSWGLQRFPTGELRGGAFDYDLFRGGVSGSSPNDWFLRSDFVVASLRAEVAPPGHPVPPTPPVVPPVTSLPSDPPPNPLPPGVFPIIGPELATYGVVQPLARQLGLSILGTLDDRVGDTYEPDGCAVAPARSAAAETSPVDLPTRKPAAVPTKKPGPAPCPLFSPSVWGRFFGQTIHNHYQRLRRSARQRQSRRLPGRHRSSARISDRRPL